MFAGGDTDRPVMPEGADRCYSAQEADGSL